MSLIFRIAFIGAVIGCVLKFGSPHKNWESWLVACLIGSVGAILGLFVVRMFGFGQEYEIPAYVGSALAAGGLVVFYAVASRAIHRKIAQRGRLTRPTIVF